MLAVLVQNKSWLMYGALSDSHGSFRPSLPAVEARLVMIGHYMSWFQVGCLDNMSLRHAIFRDVTTESYVIDGVEIVVY